MPDATKTPQNRIDALVSLKRANKTGPDTPLITGQPFQTISGGESQMAEELRDRDPGSHFDSPVPGSATVTDITVTRTWKTDRDDTIYKQLVSNVGLADGTCGRVVRDIRGDRAGLHSYRVLLVGVTGPEGDTNGNGKGMLSLTLRPDGPPA